MILIVGPVKVVAKAHLVPKLVKRFTRQSFAPAMLHVLLITIEATANAEMATVATLTTGKDVQLP